MSQVEFINRDEIQNHKSEQALFLTIEMNTVTSSISRTNKSGMPISSLAYDNTYLFLKLWYSNNEPDKIIENKSDRQSIIEYSLFSDYTSVINPLLIFGSDYSLGGHVRNWNVGILKNYLQTIINEMNGVDSKLVKNVNLDELEKLQTQTLYIPDYIFIKFNKWNGNENKYFDESDLMKGYKFPYKIISQDELNDKILDEQNPIYYLIYVKIAPLNTYVL